MAMRRVTLRWIALLTAGALLLAASFVKTQRAVHVSSAFAPIAIDLTLDGHSFARVVEPDSTVSVGARIVRADTSMAHAIEVRAESPCGPFALDHLHGAHVFVHDDGLIDIEVYPSQWPLWIDNRGQPATTLVFGGLALPVPAGAVRRYEIPVAGCRGEQPIRLGTRDLGTVALHGLSTAGLTNGGLLVDATGLRCYATREVAYGARPGFAGPAPPHALEQAWLHSFDHAPDYVLESPPPQVEEWSDRRLPTLATERTQVLEVPCLR